MYRLLPLDFWDIFNYTFRIMRRRLGLIYLSMGWIYLPLALLLNLNSLGGPAFAPGSAVPPGDMMYYNFLMILLLLIHLVLASLINAGPTWIASRELQGKDSSFWGVFESIFKDGTWLRLVGVGAVVAAVVFAGGLFLVLPGLFLLFMFSLVTPVLVLERKRGLLEVLGRSWYLVWKNFGRVLLVILVLLLFSYLLSLITGFPVLLISFYPLVIAESTLLVILLSLISACLELLVAPVVPLVLTLLYLDLRARREGIDLRKRLAEVAGEGGV